MFTGIIQEIGQVIAKTIIGNGFHLAVKSSLNFLSDVKIGDSIAINGACMTVVKLDGDVFYIDISAHSLSIITELYINEYVNLEKALQFNSFIGGHLVSGHVDGTTKVESFTKTAESYTLVVTIDNHQQIENLGQFMVVKGSVTLNGVSLTINSVKDVVENCFKSKTQITLNLIPHTIENTNFKYTKVSDNLNLEIDMLARYMQRLLSFNA